MNKYLYSLLLLAALTNQLQSMDFDFTEIDAKQQEAMNNWLTSLTQAIRDNQHENALFIIKQPHRNFSLDERVDAQGNTLLMVAVLHHNFFIVKTLIELGVNKDLTNNEGQTALDLADIHIQNRDRTIIKYLTQKGVKRSQS